jgi:hypothetical protein
MSTTVTAQHAHATEVSAVIPAAPSHYKHSEGAGVAINRRVNYQRQVRDWQRRAGQPVHSREAAE